ncbi:MAG TPA: family 78 glycoside hydrolase catalytic domain, partial [Lacipirellulaceae bacterium]|nr:family 78 glycoside hydrolase catalytic domain [Lacipirellulaceae bacterium]
MHVRTLASAGAWLATLLSLPVGAAFPAMGMTARGLRCEFLDAPEGIDARAPRLSWINQSDERGERQTGYRLLVASSAEKLAQDQGDLWDTGRVDSSESIHVPYAGAALATHQECYWKVQVWDAQGTPSAWSEPSRWSMGVLAPGDWGAQWIGLEGSDGGEFLAGANWIWFPEGNPAQSAPPETRYFRRRFELPADRAISKALLRISADDRCTVWLNGEELGDQRGHAAAKEFDVTERLARGGNVIAVAAENEGADANPAGLLAWLEVQFAEGAPLVVISDGGWKTAAAAADRWFASEFDDAQWPPAKTLAAVGSEPWGPVSLNSERRLPARQLRKEFAVGKDVKRAIVSYCGLGVSELYLNGEKVGDHVLSPAGSQYDKRVFYVTFDVTDRVRRGDNAIGVLLGNGRYYAPRSKAAFTMPNFGYPKLLLHLRVDHADGTTSTIVSDPTWKLSTEGPIIANNEFDGEEYDARRELGAWTSARYDDSHWQRAPLAETPPGAVCAQMIDPIRVTQTLKPVAITEPRPGVYIVDMGQNMVGWCRIRVRGPAGTAVQLRHAETLLPDGHLYLANIRTARVTDVYTLRGGPAPQGAAASAPAANGAAGVEQWEPRFTYHGFRFVEVTGWPGKLTVDDIDGRVVHDDLRSAGEFACSSALINQIYQNVLWGTRGNYRSFPTDCPQRDERQGWLGDRGEISRGEMYIYDGSAFYAKWVQDIGDATRENGSVSDVCPAHWPIYSDNVTWPSTTVLLPNSLHRQYADERIVAQHYDKAKRWVDYMLTFVEAGIIERDQYGDWCVPPEDPRLIHSKDPARQTSKPLLATSYLYNDLRIMERFATRLGKTEDAARFAEQAEILKAAFNAKFLDRAAGQYDNGSQTSCVLPLAFGLVPEDMKPAIFDRLVRKITEETNNHIGTGLIGGQFLCRVLTAGGRADLAYTIATQTDYPSWGYMISQGATTVWELWNGDTADPSMNSGTHVMLVGDLVIWLYEHLAGIRPDDAQPGFKHIVMRPEIVPGLAWVRAKHHSP